MSAVKLPAGKLYQDKYNIYDPDKVDFKPRLDFLENLTGEVEIEVPLEDIIEREARNHYREPGLGEVDLYQAVLNYRTLKGMGARLPKFSKWLTSLFVANPVVQKAVADAGQHQHDKVILSTDMIDLLRSGDTPHFQTCYNIAGGYDLYSKMPVRIAEETPGVMIAYVDDDKGKMKGRVWVQAVELPDKSNAVMVRSAHGNISLVNVVAALQQKGAKVLIPRHWGNGIAVEPKAVTVKTVGGFTKQENFDFYNSPTDAYVVQSKQ